MKKVIILIAIIFLSGSIFGQETDTVPDKSEIVKITDEAGVTKIIVNGNVIMDLEETENGVQLNVFDENVVELLHEENRVVLKLKEDALSGMLDENESPTKEDINLAIGEINEQLLSKLENSEIDENEVDVEIQNEEVHFDIEDNGLLEIREYDDGVKINIREKPMVDIEENRDTTKIRIGKKGLKIIEDGDGTTVEVVDEDEFDDSDDNEKERRGKDFKGHWAGLELGLNNYMNQDFNISRDENSEFMDLNTGRSINVNINFLQYNLGLGTDKVGLTTGLGIEFSNYFFDNNNNIAQNEETGEIYELDYDVIGINLSKSKLTTTYLTVPLILEAQIGSRNRSKRVHLSGGVLGALKIGSHTKVVYKENGSKQKDKNRDDFNLNSLRYGITARAGYKALNLYANYYLTPFFEDGKGPELYPFAVGFALVF
jgi:hypothetical protein